ncbi:hypothetical protein ZIOFF_043422 [Zingiber officinale]|uniref:Integrase catalytic domain-containing protein n=1 Tax=Zingiber officinale TaxID=94328 RepID=A0A8J5KZJ7_ZINOF|nr:hypothetical protein ZIOFF_043422 [Zingiber officinale]
MGGSQALQQRFDVFLKIYQEDKTSNEKRQQLIHAQLEELSKSFSNLHSHNNHQGEESNNHADPQMHRSKRYHGHEEGSSYIPRYSKLDFPRYDGESDPLGWLNRCDHFFLHQRTLEEEKVGLASFHLEGDGQLWFIKLERDRPHIQWEEVKYQCNLRFGPPIRYNKLGELAKLQQSGSVEEYQRKFEKLAARVSSLTSEQEVQIFISGLQDHIVVEVDFHHPEDLTSAMSFARLYECCSKRSESTVTPRRTPVLPPKQPFIKRLNRTEMEERRVKGLCFNCDELYIPGHRCKRLFGLEGLEDYDEQNHVEDVEISLNAITGTHAPQTMRIQGRINDTPLLVLINSGRYGVLSSPLTSLLRRNSFEWNEATELAFQNLKIALISTPVLALPDFSKPFVVNCDASNMGISAILQQEGRLITFFSRRNNVAADALSRCDNNNGQLTAISMPKLNLTEDIQSEYSTSPEIQHLIQVHIFVRECPICEHNKVEHLKLAGLLQPLPVPHQVWSDISMDFIDGLPLSQDKTVLFVVVDHFSKYAHFIPLSHPYTVVKVARVFFDNIFKLHGLPETIVSDRDATFTSSFWKELFRLSGTQLCFSSTYHSQSDGQTEAVNRVIEMHLHCFMGEFPKKWVYWIS